MPLPPNLDFDKLMNAALNDIGGALRGWLSGRILEEVALTNRVTESLSRGRRGCDVGVTTPVTMRSEVSILHRKGPNHTDMYGADLALTVYTDDGSFLKTALFQLKKSAYLHVEVKRQQLQDAMLDSRIEDRSFVCAVDEFRHTIRLWNVGDLYTQLVDNQESKQFDCTEWDDLTRWSLRWLSCDIGKSSTPWEPNSVEALLQRFVPRDDMYAPWAFDADADLPADYLPCRAWLKLLFESRKPGSSP